MARGGYQAPASPAPASGPGALSQRTDGGPIRDLPNAKYGENAEFREIQAGAPMATAGGDPTSPPSGGGTVPVGFDAETQNPEEPVTSGAELGPGPGPEALGFAERASQARAAIAPRILALVGHRANQPDVSQDFRAFIRYLESEVNGQ